MACFTMVTIDVPSTKLNDKAREALGLPAAPARLTVSQAKQVRMEAGVIKTKIEIRRLQPTAIIRRNGDQLTVSVSV